MLRTPIGQQRSMVQRRVRQRRHTQRQQRSGTPSSKQGLLGWLLRLLASGAGEFTPWLSWKVYDVLWALALLWLGRRLKWVRDAQELLDL